MEYSDAEAGTLPATHLPPGPVTPPAPPVLILYSDELCGKTQDFPDIEYWGTENSNVSHARAFTYNWKKLEI